MNWTEQDIARVWTKGHVVPNYDASKWRRDDYGNPIAFAEYGNRDSKHGWEIDHISPGENHALSNLRPLQWANNVAKSDKMPR